MRGSWRQRPLATHDARGRGGAGRGRPGGRAAVVVGALLAALMAYALLPWGRGPRTPPPPAPADAVDVAVFFPDRADWDDFRGGARAVVGRGLAEVVADTSGSMTLRTSGRRRAVRFA